MTLNDFMTVVDYKITEGSGYQWSCYGNNAYCLDSEGEKGHTVSILFDTQTQVVYSTMAYDYTKNRAYRWMNPDFVELYKAEGIARNIRDRAWDDVAYIDLEVKEDFLEKARAIITGADYDERTLITLELDKETMFQLMQLAHNEDITLNALVEQILRNESIKGE